MRKVARLIFKTSFLTYFFFSSSCGADSWSFPWIGESNPSPSLSSSQRPLLLSKNSTELQPVYLEPVRGLPLENVVIQTNTLTPVTKPNRKKSSAYKIPTPPSFLPLSVQKMQDLTDKAKSGDKIALKLLMERIHWKASKNPLTLDDVMKIKQINKKALSAKGYLYWSLLDECGGLRKRPEIFDIIKSCAITYNLATAQYQWGLIIDKSWSLGGKEESLKWYEKAAAQGYAPAQFSLGEMYKEGDGGLTKNEEKAIEFYKISADQGYLPAMFHLGFGLRINQKEASLLDYQSAFSLLFNSFWAKVNNTRWEHNNAHDFIFDIIEYKKIDDNKIVFEIDNEKHFKNILLENSSLKTQLKERNFQGMPENIELSQALEKIQECTKDIPEIIDGMRTIDPGFFIDCVKLRERQKEAEKIIQGFFCCMSLNQCSDKIYMTIGEKNKKVSCKIYRWIELYNEIFSIRDDIKKRSKKYQDKVIDLNTKKRALYRLIDLDSQIPSSESKLIPKQFSKNSLKIRVHEMMIQSCNQALEALQVWEGPLKTIASCFKAVLEEGVNQRNKDFFEVYGYYRYN